MGLAIIPARGGSKRIPRKNIKEFCGKPIIAYSIEAALASNCFDRVIVSTDDEEIAAVARKYGAEVPFVRPKELADDYATTVAVIGQAIEWLADNGDLPEQVCCIYATAPFITVADIQQGQHYLKQELVDFAISVTSFAFPIQRAVKLDDDKRLSMFQPEHFNTRSQDLTEAYHDAAQFYWGKASAWLAQAPLFGAQTKAVVLPRSRVQDIDTLEDWCRAEFMFKAMLQELG
jgi:N-acylneuraminate cytidylyltransferase